MTTLVVEAGELQRDALELDADRFHRLFRVRRLRVDERLRLVDGAGRARWAVVENVDRRRALLQVVEPAPTNEPETSIHLMVAAPRPQRAGWLVEKATEVGVRSVRFLNSERSPRSYGRATLERLRRLAVAAVEQCDRSVVPEVTGVHPWDDAETLLEGAEGRWILDLAARRRLPSRSDAASHALAVGPEGGWTEEESRLLSALGCCGATLGPRTLRVETAALVGAALLVIPSVDTL